jgi:hypothetical protein
VYAYIPNPHPPTLKTGSESDIENFGFANSQGVPNQHSQTPPTSGFEGLYTYISRYICLCLHSYTYMYMYIIYIHLYMNLHAFPYPQNRFGKRYRTCQTWRHLRTRRREATRRRPPKSAPRRPSRGANRHQSRSAPRGVCSFSIFPWGVGCFRYGLWIMVDDLARVDPRHGAQGLVACFDTRAIISPYRDASPIRRNIPPPRTPPGP